MNQSYLIEPLTWVNDIATLHDHYILLWKKEGFSAPETLHSIQNQLKSTQHNKKSTHFLLLTLENHGCNFQLWHAEDRARRNDKGHTFVYQAKREIDAFNQHRNNYMESIDAWLFEALQPNQTNHCPVHSETPGMIIDRLSILALKAYHMKLQHERQDVDDTHRQTCLNKFHTIQVQQQQLQHCLTDFLTEIIQHTRTFRVYHQFKMYNNPDLNPELVNERMQRNS